jgi:putative hydrolase of the HAD superfamily
MLKAAFSSVDTWIFDLDNTLYPAGSRLFAQIESRMTAFVARELRLPQDQASRLRKQMWQQHGTTLAGLMADYAIDPDPYLAEVHDIDYSVLPASPALRDALHALPGRRHVFTNGSRAHGHRTISALGLQGTFDGIYGIEDAGYVPKPQQTAFDRVFGLIALDPARSAMFEDDPANLAVPHAMGLRTVLVGQGPAQRQVHHDTADLTDFLTQLI